MGLLWLRAYLVMLSLFHQALMYYPRAANIRDSDMTLRTLTNYRSLLRELDDLNG